MQDLIIVGTVSDNAFVEDIAHQLKQPEDYSDIISLKSFLNREFCPRFIIDEANSENIGKKLVGKTVLIVNTSYSEHTRDELAMRSCLVARAAKDNGASRVVLLEPDLFYGAQDRGPRPEQGFTRESRSDDDYRKFDGQPFSARLYADLLKLSGVDEVISVHVHSDSVKHIFLERFSGSFHNLIPSDVYAAYMKDSDIISLNKLTLCAPDRGAREFALDVQKHLAEFDIPVVCMDKVRGGEREVEITLAHDSPAGVEALTGREVVVLDDMVRTGHTIVECCHRINEAKPEKVLFFVTHFYSSREGRVNLNDPVISEIVSSSTIPQILNRDVQGRLRHKMVVLRLARWISDFISQTFDNEPLKPPLYKEDMSSKNPRWKGKMGPLFSGIE